MRHAPRSVTLRRRAAPAGLAALLVALALWSGAGAAGAVGAVGAVGAAGAGAAARHAPRGELARATAGTRGCASVPRARPGEVVVPVVVDFGGPAADVAVTCVQVANGASGSQVLAKRAQMLGTPAPRYDPNTGLLCAIDGHPVSGCGQVKNGHYQYWAYYHGGSSWSYANGGPAAWPVRSGDVEGWRFQPKGSGSPLDPPPRAPSRASVLLGTATRPSVGSTTTTSAPPVTTGGAPTSSAPAATAPPRSGGTSGGTPTTKSGGTPPAAGHATSPTSATSTASAAGGGTAPATSSPHVAGRALGSGSNQAGGSTSGTGRILGLVAALVAIALVGGGAAVRSRRSPRGARP